MSNSIKRANISLAKHLMNGRIGEDSITASAVTKYNMAVDALTKYIFPTVKELAS